MSYNIQALFAFYDDDRISKLVEWIRDQFLEKSIDVICLQEAFEFDIYDKLYEMVKQLSLYIMHPSIKRKMLIGENSGLVVISRMPLYNPSFYEYKVTANSCQCARKGMFNVQVLVNDCRVNVVNTHLQSEHDGIAINQFRSMIHTLKNQSTIILGDMNMSYATMSKWILSNNIRSANSSEQTTFPSNQEQLDYCILYNLDIPSGFEVQSNVLHSDHFPIRVVIPMIIY